MRVDDVPLLLKPAFHAYGYGLGTLFDWIETSIRRCCRIQRHAATTQGPRIECIWHENLPAYIAAYLPPAAGERYVWMNHPIWYMRPIHVLLARRGVEALALGSSGHGGKAALQHVADHVRRGFHTSFAVDGPLGPARVLKPGALDLALQTGAELVAIRFEYERSLRSPGWDRKHMPALYSTIRVHETAFAVRPDNYAAVQEALPEALG
jgi:lysophospholipid acyltransferase (LPLAT)-like uncharacterized protein